MMMKMIYRLMMIVLPTTVSLAMLSGCGRGYIYDDEWHASKEVISGPPDEGNLLQHWEVIPERQEEAQVLLAEARYVRLTEEQAREFAGQEIPGLGAPYLIRAVHLWSKGFRVYLNKDGQVIVSHISMGAFATVWRVNRYALIVRLKSAPKKVIPLCGAVV